MKDVIDYLQKKMDECLWNNNAMFSAPILIKYHLNYEKKATLEDMVQAAIHQIVVHSSKAEVVGICKLTAVSVSIGNKIFLIMGKTDKSFNDKVRVGDLMIEAMLQSGYVSVYRDPSFSKFNNRAPYVLQLENKWSEIAEMTLVRDKAQLRGTLMHPPPPVKKSVIKRTTMRNEEWDEIKDSQHISAIEKLEKVPYQVNLEVLHAVKNARELFVPDDKLQIPKDGNKSKMDKAYSEMRLEANRAKGKDTPKLRKLKKKYEKEAILWNTKLQALKARSKRTAHEFVMQKATLLQYEPEFYQTIEVDYRGRFYFKESFFNFQGNDVSRGLLQFANGVLMDAKGERALAIHTASCYNESFDIDNIPSYFETDYKKHLESEGLESISVDKMTLDDRERWTKNNIDLLINYANDNEIRMEAEKPVCFLACCYEWRKLLLNPDTHMTHLLIQIDGSNNGWQHLGAMSKDEHTGLLVGLIPQDIQKDFYVQTAKKLMQMEPDWFEEKQMPMKHIRKGISKRGSMTRAYSAGEKVMGINMYADCHQEGFTEKYGITVDDCNNLSHKLIQAINEVCPGPLNTMSYLQKLANYELGTFKWFDKDGKVADQKYRKLKKDRSELMYKKDKTDQELMELNDLSKELQTYTNQLVDGNGSTSLSWTTPSGFLVQYKCFRTRQISCKGTIKGVGRIEHKGVEETDYPDVGGYAAGISPNYVHSLDSSHMSIVIDNWDYDFSAVHDAFAVHAPYVDELLHVTKEAFIAMYDVPNFYDLIEESLLSNTDNLNIEQPLIGNLEISGVRKSPYFFA